HPDDAAAHAEQPREETAAEPDREQLRVERERAKAEAHGRGTLTLKDELLDAARAPGDLRNGGVDALARLGRGHGRARAGWERLRRGGCGRIHPAGRRAAPERPRRRPAGPRLAGR